MSMSLKLERIGRQLTPMGRITQVYSASGLLVLGLVDLGTSTGGQEATHSPDQAPDQILARFGQESAFWVQSSLWYVLYPDLALGTRSSS